MSAGEFAALQTLRLLDFIVVDEDLDALLSRCPRLRVLELRNKITTWRGLQRKRTVHSATLHRGVRESMAEPHRHRCPNA
jgi:hypothetical protein